MLSVSVIPKMTFSLCVDCRERGALSLGVFADAEQKQLDIGDFAVVSRDVEQEDRIVLAIERKSLADLAASIKDGRYTEQKCRAVSVLGLGRFVYICEVGSDFEWSGCADGGVRSAIINTMIRDGVPVFFSRDVADTCALVRSMYEKVCQKGEAFFRGAPVAGVAYKACFKKRGDNAKDPRSVAELQLSQIPGVSLNNAAMIMNTFGAGTLPALMTALQRDPQARKTLMSVEGVGKKKVDALMTYLLGDT